MWWWQRMWAPLLSWSLAWGAVNLLAGPFNKYETGRWCRRLYVSNERINSFLRDIHLTGSEYEILDIHSIAETDDVTETNPSRDE